MSNFTLYSDRTVDGTLYHRTALSFNGTSQYVNVPHNTSLNFGTGDFTVNFWMKRETVGGLNRGVIGKRPSAATAGWSFRFAAGGNTWEFICIDSSLVTNVRKVIPFTLTPVGVWTMITLVRVGNALADFRIHVNGGSNVGTDFLSGATLSGDGSVSNTEPLTIGAQFPTSDKFIGQLADVQLYNTALTQAQIERLYNEGTGASPLILGNDANSIFVNNLRLWHKLESEQLYTNEEFSVDQSGLKNHGTLIGYTPDVGTIYSEDKIIKPFFDKWELPNGVQSQNSLLFDGTDDIVTIPHSTSNNAIGSLNFSISLWVQPISNIGPSERVILSKRVPTGTTVGCMLTMSTTANTNTFGFVMFDGTNSINQEVFDTITWTANQWYHIVITRNNNNLRLYRDNILIRNLTNAAMNAKSYTNTTNLIFGDWQGTRYANMRIADLQIYNRTISDSEISDLYSSRRTFLRPTGKLRRSWGFDGSSSFVQVADSASLNFGTDSFSISTWVYLTSEAGIRVIAGNLLTLANGWALWYSNSLRTFVMETYTGGAFTRYAAQPDFNWTLNTWSHVLFVRDVAANEFRFYRNGVLRSGGLSTIRNVTAINPMRIGHSAYYSDQHWAGRLDETQIYNRALTPAEVAHLYNGGIPNLPPTTALPNLVARYSFDTYTGTLPNPVLEDLSGNGNNGTGQTMTTIPTLPPNLISYYNFAETPTSTTITDRSGNGNTGTLSGFTSLNYSTTTKARTSLASDLTDDRVIDTPYKWCASFTGGTQEINLGDPTVLRFGTGDFSVAFWGKVDSILNIGAGGPGISKNIDTNNRLWMTYRNFGSGRQIRFQIRNTNLVKSILFGTNANPVWAIGEWFHLVLVKVGNDPNNWLMYRNGRLFTTKSVELNDVVTVNADLIGGQWRIGRENMTVGTTGTGNNRFSNVQFFNRALTAGEAAELASRHLIWGDTPVSAQSALAGKWLLNDIAGTNVRDYSANGNNGTVNNADVATNLNGGFWLNDAPDNRYLKI